MSTHYGPEGNLQLLTIPEKYSVVSDIIEKKKLGRQTTNERRFFEVAGNANAQLETDVQCFLKREGRLCLNFWRGWGENKTT